MRPLAAQPGRADDRAAAAGPGRWPRRSAWSIFLDERRHAVRAADRAQVLSRTVSVVRLLGDTPPELSERIIRDGQRPAPGLLAGRGERGRRARSRALDPLAAAPPRLLAGTGSGRVLVRLEDSERFLRLAQGADGMARLEDDDDDHTGDDDDEDHRTSGAKRDYWEKRRHRLPLSLTVSVRLADGRWLNAATLVPPPAPAWAWPSLLSMGLMAAGDPGHRGALGPAHHPAAAALAGGGGQLRARPGRRAPGRAGPDDVRRTIHAFNEMQRAVAPLRRATGPRMLAAISHDLRTPITTLRLRAEFIEDPEIRDKILETLDEMQQMTEATLAFAARGRGARGQPPGRPRRLDRRACATTLPTPAGTSHSPAPEGRPSSAARSR